MIDVEVIISRNTLASGSSQEDPDASAFPLISRVVKILSRVKIHDKHGTCDALESRISAVAGRTAEFGAEGVGLATRLALLHKSRPLICVASSLLLAEAIRASSVWKILLIGVLSQLQMIKGISHWLYLGGSRCSTPGTQSKVIQPASGEAIEEPKPFVPVFVVANDVRAIDSAIQDVIDVSRNLNAETSRQGVIPGRGERGIGSPIPSRIAQ